MSPVLLRPVLEVVDLDEVDGCSAVALRDLVTVLEHKPGPVVGVRRRRWSAAARRVASKLDLTLCEPPPRRSPHPSQAQPPRYAVAVGDVDAALGRVGRTLARSPRAGSTLCQVLRITPGLRVPDALAVESLAYSMLLAGPEFLAWRERTPRRDSVAPAEPVRLARDGGRLDVVLDDEARRNAFGRGMRDALVEAFSLVAADPTIREVHLRGEGPAFCSGGDLDEFATTPDVALAHQIRMRRSVAAAVHGVSDRVVVHLHGWCVGAGMEIPSFAGRVLVSPDTRLRLPELSMGLIPGAGGTVGIPRRIGRWRTAYLALTGDHLTATMARQWGLADATNR